MKKNPSNRGLPAALPHAAQLEQTFAAQARPMRLDDLLRVLRLPRRSKKNLLDLLENLADQGRLIRLPGGLWAQPQSLRTVIGRFSALRNGGGLVSPQRDPANGRVPSEIYIPPEATAGAWHQDTVRAALTPGNARGGTGRVLEVLERGLKEVPAHVRWRTGSRLLCSPADARLPVEFSVELPPDAAPPATGALVLLAPLEPLAADLWAARLLGDYGQEDTVDVQEALVKINHQAPRDFPPAALDEAAALPSGPTAQDLEGREDLRGLPMVTIDGADARDFDDAVQVSPRPGGGWLLRVAIADVSHYVRPRGRGAVGALDAEALARGNSWYFPRSVEPMLPPALCDGLCSLRPGEDRLAVLAEIPFTAAGAPGQARFALAVMRSAARLTYDQVKACLLDKDVDARAALAAQPRGQEVLDMLETAFQLFAVLRAAREARGSLDFDLPEADSRQDAAGRVVWLGHRQRHNAHRLIEEFMIAANEAVARHLRDAGLPFLYRVHPQPDPERLESLFDTLTAAGLPLPPQPAATALQGILRAAHGTEQEFLVNRLCLRAMPQARYQPINEGHFGLASAAYCHFTSPIRRYADLLVHRALKYALGHDVGRLPAGQKLLRIGDQLNRSERAALACEREMERRLGCLALLPRVGEHFSGVVAGLNEHALFVELGQMPVEGMIRVEDLGGDWYQFDARRMALVGEHSGALWRMGQQVDVALTEVNLGRLEIRLLPLALPKGVTMRRGRSRPQGRDARRGPAGRTVRTGKPRSDKPRNGKTPADKTARRKTASDTSARNARPPPPTRRSRTRKSS